MAGYTLKDGTTLKNRLGAKSFEELEEFSSSFVVQRKIEIVLGAGPKGQFDLEHLQAIHRYLFQDVFEWAGHLRVEQVKLSDGVIASEPIMKKLFGKDFAAGAQIVHGLRDLFEQISQANQLKGLSRSEFSVRAADLFSFLNGIHPFREGNGRTQRTFFSLLAKEAGHSLDFRPITMERMYRASVAAHEKGDLDMMRRMFDEISTPKRVEILLFNKEKLENAYEQAGKGRAKVNETLYLATFTPGRKEEVVFAGQAGDNFMARSEHQVLFGKVEDLPNPPPALNEKFEFTAAYPEKHVSAQLSALIPAFVMTTAEMALIEARAFGQAQSSEPVRKDFEAISDFAAKRFHDSQAFVEAVTAALPLSRTKFEKRIHELVADADRFGGLRGETGAFAGKAAKTERLRALEIVPILAASSIGLKTHLDTQCGYIKAKTLEAYDKMKIEIPGVSDKAFKALQAIATGASEQQKQARAIIASDPVLSTEVSKAASAVAKRFGVGAIVGDAMDKHMPLGAHISPELRNAIKGAAIEARQTELARSPTKTLDLSADKESKLTL